MKIVSDGLYDRFLNDGIREIDIERWVKGITHVRPSFRTLGSYFDARERRSMVYHKLVVTGSSDVVDWPEYVQTFVSNDQLQDFATKTEQLFIVFCRKSASFAAFEISRKYYVPPNLSGKSCRKERGRYRQKYRRETILAFLKNSGLTDFCQLHEIAQIPCPTFT